jgi:hypothetical protein
MVRFFWIFLLVSLIASGELRAADSEEFKTIENAQVSIGKSLKSGRGVGTFKLSERASATDPWKVTTSAIISANFDGEKYHVDLTYDPRAKSYVRRIIIYDGESISTSRFSPRIKPYGAEADICDKQSDEIHIPDLTELDWDVAQLHLQALSLKLVSKHFGKDAIKLTHTDSGDIKGEYALSKVSKALFTCDRKLDFNVSEVLAWNEGSKSPAQTYSLKWKKDKDVWYVSEICNEMAYPDSSQQRSELKYDTFEPNAIIDPAIFERSSLELPPKARTIDRRKKK